MLGQATSPFRNSPIRNRSELSLHVRSASSWSTLWFYCTVVNLTLQLITPWCVLPSKFNKYFIFYYIQLWVTLGSLYIHSPVACWVVQLAGWYTIIWCIFQEINVSKLTTNWLQMKEIIQHCLLLSLLAHPLEMDSVLAWCLYKCKCSLCTYNQHCSPQ